MTTVVDVVEVSTATLTVQVLTASAPALIEVPTGPPGPPGAPGPAGAEGPAGPAGGDVTLLTAHTDLSGHRAVAFRSDASVEYADVGTPAHGWAAVAVTTGAALAGEPVEVRSHGMLTEPTWAWAPLLPVFFGAAGALTQLPPSTPGQFARVVGVAASPTRLWIDPQPPIVLT